MKKAERNFTVSLVVPESKLGPLMADLDNRFQIGVHLNKEIAPGKNAPRGSFLETAKEILGSGNGRMTMKKLKENLAGRGFTESGIHSGVSTLIKNKNLLKDGDVLSINKAKG